jgi:hypothetical protein
MLKIKSHVTKAAASNPAFVSKEAAMAARLGNVVYWLGVITAALWAAIVMFIYAYDKDHPAILVLMVGSVAIWLAGWAIWYILTPSSPHT